MDEVRGLLDDVHPILQQPVVRHELAHAPQDQYWPLTTWLAGAERNEDRAAAMQAVLEGHASDVMNRVTLGRLGLDGSGLSAAQEAGLMAELEELFGDMDLGGSSSADLADFAQLWGSGTFVPEHQSPGTFTPGWKQAWSSPPGRLVTHVLFTNQSDPVARDPGAAQWAATNRDKDVAVSANWAGDHVVVQTPVNQPPGTYVPGQTITVWGSTWTSESAARAAADAVTIRLPAAQIVRSRHRFQVVVGAPEALLPQVQTALRTWK